MTENGNRTEVWGRDRVFGFKKFWVTCESFQADEKVEEFRERLKRSRMTGKITGKLSITRRRFMLSGPVELGCMKRGRVTKNVRSYVKEVEDRRIRYEGRRRSGRGMQGCKRGCQSRWVG